MQNPKEIRELSNLVSSITQIKHNEFFTIESIFNWEKNHYEYKYSYYSLIYTNQFSKMFESKMDLVKFLKERPYIPIRLNRLDRLF